MRAQHLVPTVLLRGVQYDHTKFQDARVARFSLIIHTSASRPHPDLLAATTPLRVVLKG